MNTRPVVMVQIADRDWTLEALHAACIKACNLSACVALVKMIPVQYAQWIGSEMGYLNLTVQDNDDLIDYQAMVKDYGLECTITLFQYDSLIEASLQAVKWVAAQVAYVPAPQCILPLWGRVQARTLAREFARQQIEWVAQPVYGTVAESVAAELMPQTAAR